MTPRESSQETLTLLKHILERQAYRLLIIGNIRGYGIQLLNDVETRMRFSREQEFNLRVLKDVERIYEAVGGTGLITAVWPKLERIRYPNSRVDVAACLAITGRAARVAAESYVDCAHREFAAVARTLLEADPVDVQAEEDLFVEYCLDVQNQTASQKYWTRWMVAALMSLGRPGTERDRRSVELGLRSRHAAEVVRQFLDDIDPIRIKCKLRMPDLDGVGIEMPEDLRGRFAFSGLHA